MRPGAALGAAVTAGVVAADEVLDALALVVVDESGCAAARSAHNATTAAAATATSVIEHNRLLSVSALTAT